MMSASLWIIAQTWTAKAVIIHLYEYSIVSLNIQFASEALISQYNSYGRGILFLQISFEAY